MNVKDVIDIIILLAATSTAIYSVILIFKCIDKWYLFFPLLFWSFHLAVFYILTIYARYSGTTVDTIFNTPGLFELWSTMEKFDGAITMLFMTYLLAIEIKYDFFRNEIIKKYSKTEEVK